MRLLPTGRADMLAYLKSHVSEWAVEYEAIGMTVEEVAALKSLVDAAEAASVAAREARLAAQAATLLANTHLHQVREAGSLALQTIKTFARRTGTNSGLVYSEARIDVPLQPSPLPAPGMVRSVGVSLNAFGQPILTWRPPSARDARERAAGRTGLVYIVQRRRPGESAFTIVHASGATGSRDKGTRFTDEPAIPGTTEYAIRAMRGGRAGPWSMTTVVEVGGVGNGLTAGTQARMAA